MPSVRSRGGLLIAALALTVGCGSTVQVTSGVSARDGLGGPSGTPGSSGEIGPSTALEGVAEGEALPGSSGATSGTVSTSGPTPGAGSSSTETAGVEGPGTTGVTASGAKKPIVVGVVTSGNATGFGNSLGLDLNFGDQRVQAKLVGDYLNSRGGVAGHKIEFTFYDYDASASAASNAQAACSAFTEDKKAFAAIGVAGLVDNYHACAAKKGMFVIDDGDLKGPSFFTRYPSSILVSDLDLARKYQGMVLGLKAMGFFTPGAKVGILYADDSNDREGVVKGMKPALASLGITKTEDIAISTADPSQNASALSSAVLKFRAQGVTHILFGVASAYVFAQAADTQGYYPKMGIESRQSPALLMQGANSSAQLVNVMGIGYQPLQDVDASRDPGPLSDTQRLCDKIYKDGRQTATTRLAQAAGYYICDELFFLSHAMQNAPDLSRGAFLKGVANVGTMYRSPLTFSTSFGAAQHAGAGSYRELRYKTDCSCFFYSGPLRRFP